MSDVVNKAHNSRQVRVMEYTVYDEFAKGSIQTRRKKFFERLNRESESLEEKNETIFSHFYRIVSFEADAVRLALKAAQLEGEVRSVNYAEARSKSKNTHLFFAREHKITEDGHVMGHIYSVLDEFLSQEIYRLTVDHRGYKHWYYISKGYSRLVFTIASIVSPTNCTGVDLFYYDHDNQSWVFATYEDKQTHDLSELIDLYYTPNASDKEHQEFLSSIFLGSVEAITNNSENDRKRLHSMPFFYRNCNPNSEARHRFILLPGQNNLAAHEKTLSAHSSTVLNNTIFTELISAGHLGAEKINWGYIMHLIQLRLELKRAIVIAGSYSWKYDLFR